MHITVDSDEITNAVAALIQERIPGSKVVEVVFTREKGGKVRADVAIELR